MTYEGTVQHGVVVFSQGQCLPEGTPVQIVPQQTLPATPDAKESSDGLTIWEKLREIAKEVESLPCDLPEDLALNHDHYLYGTPKRQ